MQSPQAQTVVITCPNCGTRYQVTPDTLGAAGRKVSCAECGKAWLATATPPEPPPPPLAPEEEDQLDAGFAAEQAALIESAADREIEATAEEAVETPARPVVSPAVRAQKKAEGRFRRRQRQVESGLPVARLRYYARLGAAAGLVGVVAGLYLFRVEVVRMVPDLAGLYSAVGLGVNTVGLEFADVTTQLGRRDGVDVLGVRGTIYPVAQRAVPVPPVLVEIRDDSGHALYQWNVTPELRTLAPGDIAPFSTELASPPTGAQSVHLSFATGNGGTASVSPEHGAEAGHVSAGMDAAETGHSDASASGHEEAAAPGADDTAHEISTDTTHSSEGSAGH